MDWIDSPEDLTAASAEMRHFLDAGDGRAAVAFADRFDGVPLLRDQFHAVTYTEAGGLLGDADLLRQAIALWANLDPSGENVVVAYNRGNAEMNLFETFVSGADYASALEQAVSHLHHARVAYRSAAQPGEDPSLRVQAQTNLGNTYDRLGRDIEAIREYRRALEIDARFGMARGNLGIALVSIAPYAGKHAASVGGEGLAELEAALLDADRIAEIGGASALTRFEAELQRHLVRGAIAHRPEVAMLEDPYLRWCGERELFLHVSPTCLRPDSSSLDPLFFRFVGGGFTDEEQQRVRRLIDSYNALKQGYLAARYQTWLATSEDSVIVAPLANVERESPYLDTLGYARFGVRTGMLIQAFAAAMNLLDQVACYSHLYLKTTRAPRSVSMRTLWRTSNNGQFDATFADVLRTEGNRGLLALCDLAADLSEPASRLSVLTELRHSATHRLLVTHWASPEPDDSGWLERVEFDELREVAVEQLELARGALVYLARLVDTNELLARRAEGDVTRGEISLSLAPLEHDLP
jgi:tetratricopeptide (TPR) repeat protein